MSQELKESLEALQIVEKNLAEHVKNNPGDIETKSHLEGVQKLIEIRKKQIEDNEQLR